MASAMNSNTAHGRLPWCHEAGSALFLPGKGPAELPSGEQLVVAREHDAARLGLGAADAAHDDRLALTEALVAPLDRGDDAATKVAGQRFEAIERDEQWDERLGDARELAMGGGHVSSLERGLICRSYGF